MSEENSDDSPDESGAALAKSDAYIHALYQSWFATSLEQTKSVFTLASAGVGLSLTVVFSQPVQPTENWAFIWLLLGMIAFAMSAVLCVCVFRVNAQIVGAIVEDEESSAAEGLAGRLHSLAFALFGGGLVFLIFAAVARIWL